MLEVLSRVTLMSFSRKGLEDLLCEIPRLFGLQQFFLPCYIGGYSSGEENVEILSIPTELEGEGELRTWEQPDSEVPKASLNLATGPFAI